MAHEPLDVRMPPALQNTSGDIRSVGVEIEFAGLSSKQAAQLVAECFGGVVKPSDTPFVFSVENTKWGDFRIELDTRFVHPEKDFADVLEDSGLSVNKENVQVVRDMDAQVREWVGKAAAGMVPTEIVSPPMPLNDLGVFTGLLESLRAHNAKGTDDGLMYSFGVHLNPEVAGEDVEYLLAILRAYVLLSDWLREQIDIDPTRKILPHIDPFPQSFAVKILAPDYAPNLETLITDYFAMNPTRNRELDMLPLFKHLAPKVLARLTDDERIKARPTFHYRLPNTFLSDPNWSVAQEWNRWVAVEFLAADVDNLRHLADRYLAQVDGPIVERLKEVHVWLKNLTNL